MTKLRMHREKRELSSSLFFVLTSERGLLQTWFAICDGVEALILGVVILNVVKNPLSDNTLSTLSLVGFEEILRFRSG